MCGIAGIIGRAALPEKAEMQAMLDCIRHRGPDGEGAFAEGNVLLGHRRLAIIDLSDDGVQPMTYAGRYTIVYNGEIYNYIELREELKALGMRFSTATDTEVVLAAYAAWGEKCLTRFNGMWAFALYDREAQTIFCARDRFGVKPFYYYDGPDAFRFGSEIKQLLPYLPHPIKADRGTLSAYLCTGELDYSERTMFRDVKQLPGGHTLCYSLWTGAFTAARWYDLADAPAQESTYEEAKDAFARLFRRAVELRLRADVPVGSTLSGGMDSSAIVCQTHEILEARAPGTPQQTISSCFVDKKFDEQLYIDAVTAHTGVAAHKVYPPIRMDAALLDKMLWHMDEPAASMGSWTVYEEAARLGLTVILVGEGADEYLAGYSPAFEALFVQLFMRGKWRAMLREMRAYGEARAASDRKSVTHMFVMTMADVLLPSALRDRARVSRRAYVPGRLLTRAAIRDPEAVRVRDFFNGRRPEEMTQALLTREMTRILHCLDRSSMAFSVETRAPFLDVALLERCYGMPLTYLIHNGVSKRVMRDALRPIMPEKVTGRHGKMGFVSPEFQWFHQDPDAVTAELRRACEKLPGIVDADGVLAWCAQHRDAQPQMDVAEQLISRIFLTSRWMDVFAASL